MPAALRILLCIPETGKLPAWEVEMAELLLSKNITERVAFVLHPPKKTSKQSLLYRLFQRFENRWFRSLPDAFEAVSLKEKFPGIPFTEAAAVAAFDPDIIYHSCLTFVGSNYKSRYGNWSVAFGNGNYRGIEPAGFWEVMNNEAVTGSSLIIQTGNEQSVVVYEGTTSSVPYSVKNNLNSIAWRSASYLPQRVNELFIMGAEKFFSKYKAAGSLPVAKQHFPGNIKMLWLFIRNSFRYVMYKCKKKEKPFQLFYSFRPFDAEKINLTLFKPIDLPAGVFWADPFLVKHNNSNYIFFEEFVYKKGKAHIRCVNINDDGVCSPPVTVLEKLYHLSYPFIFEYNHHYYMIPETSSNKTVELYRCVAFPEKWELVQVLMSNIILIDVTLLFENGKWWMFGATQSHPATSTNDQLLLFYTEDLFSGEWTAHPQNPVATHAANCRPGGRIFKHKDKLYRPAQNNASQQYGFGLNLNVIEVLNEEEYREQLITELLPDSNNGLAAVHSLTIGDGLMIIDGIAK